MSGEAVVKERGKLNPFVFPSDTDLYFILLIVSVIGVSLIIFSMLYNSIPGVYAKSLETQGACIVRAETAFPNNPFSRSDFFERCMLPADRVRAAWMLLGVIFLLAVSSVIFWRLPDRKIQKEKLQVLSREDAPEILDYLHKLCAEIRLPRAPNFVWSPLNASVGGMAFGRLNDMSVSLTGGLISLFYTDLEQFRAIVLHELAHIKNRDINKTYFAVSVWKAFVAVVIVPFAILQPYSVFLLDKSIATVFGQSWRLAGLALLVYLGRNAVLRYREYYADVRAAGWDPGNMGLMKALQDLKPLQTGAIKSILEFHPDPSVRIETIHNPDRLFKPDFWLAFGSGATAMIAYSGFRIFFGFIAGPTLAMYYLENIFAALIFAPLVVGIAGSSVWRSKYLVMMRSKTNNKLHSVSIIGIGVGLGALVGNTLNILTYMFLASSDAGFLDRILLFATRGLWYLSLFISLLLFFSWSALGTNTWLEVVVSNRQPRRIFYSGIIAGSIVLTPWLAFLFHSYPGGGFGNIMQLSYLSLARTPIPGFLLAVIWAYPLAAWFWRKTIKHSLEISWPFLDAGKRDVEIPALPPLRLGWAFLAGLVGGIAFFIISVPISFAAFIILSDENLVQWALYGQVAVSIFLQMGVVTVVTARVRRLRKTHGLFAGLITGSVSSVGAMAIYLLLSLMSGTPLSFYLQTPPFATFFTISGNMINVGTLISIPLAWLVSFLARTIQRP